ncbi:MAG: hypothetical protein JWM80_2780 [Cyanobacteria bacterium RYN_339]|nr:hypothetical protein [Cyanobacteria bacterium RYN_339]
MAPVIPPTPDHLARAAEVRRADPAWDAILARARAVDKQAGVPAPETLTQRETLPPEQATPLRQAVLVVPARLDPGPALAVRDLEAYLRTVTGRPVQMLLARPGEDVVLPPEAAGATVFAVGDVRGLVPAAGGKESYAIRGGDATVGGQRRAVVGVSGGDAFGLQRGVYRLMELSGKRFYSYTDAYTPPAGKAVAPANGFSEVHAPAAWMKTRGFAPHLYHPVPLQKAFHEPSAEHLDMVKRYIDWHVANGQNFIMFPMLELDQKHGLLPITSAKKKNFEAWLPHARAIVDYAHQRGVKLSVKLAFANYVSSNAFAINPLVATYQSLRLEHARKNPVKYDALLAKYRAEDRAKIEATIDRYMRVPWDEITWNLGTSEFTPTNDDLTIGWMDDAAAYLKRKYPGVETSARSHVPNEPWSEKYNDSYFNLPRFADPSVGVYVHTTSEYALTDKAPVYGNQDFTHKLKMLSHATPERKDVFYPETSYWVAHDVSVPLFLPVYMLNRKHDLEIIKQLPNLDGEVGFTTAWEWGYWLNDYAQARMQDHPEESLTEILDGAFAPLEAARTPMVQLMIESMTFQQEFLLDKNLIKYLQGFDALTDFGVSAQRNPVLGKVLKGTNSTPVRLRPDEIMKWDAGQLARFERGDLADLVEVARTFSDEAARADELRAKVPAAAAKLQDELADGFQINALRARQVLALQRAVVMLRRSQLTPSPALRAQALAQLAEAKALTDRAMVAIADREKDYREGPEYNLDKGDGLTIWNDRSLTPVHTAKYWRNSYDEVAKLLGQPKLPD